MANRPRTNRQSIKQTKSYAVEEIQIEHIAEVAARTGAKSDSEALRQIIDEHRLFLSAMVPSTEQSRERNKTELQAA